MAEMTQRIAIGQAVVALKMIQLFNLWFELRSKRSFFGVIVLKTVTICRRAPIASVRFYSGLDAHSNPFRAAALKWQCDVHLYLLPGWCTLFDIQLSMATWESGTSGRRLQAFCSTVWRIVCTLFASHVTRAICLLWMEKLIQFETYFFLSMRFLLILYKLCCCWNCFHAVLISWVYLL